MASMSCCKTGASLPLDPCGSCLVFLIPSEGSFTNADGIKYYRPHGGCQMFWSVDLRLDWMESFASSLSPLGALEQHSAETKGLYLLITLRRPIDHKIINSFNLKYLETVYLFRGSQAPFIVILSTTFTHENIISIESIYNRKIFCLRVPLLTHGANNKKESRTPLFTCVCYLINNFINTYI